MFAKKVGFFMMLMILAALVARSAQANAAGCTSYTNGYCPPECGSCSGGDGGSGGGGGGGGGGGVGVICQTIYDEPFCISWSSTAGCLAKRYCKYVWCQGVCTYGVCPAPYIQSYTCYPWP